MKDIRELIKEKRVYFDGGTGTVLQKKGLQPGEAPETWNITQPHKIVTLHKSYLKAGTNILKTNTFGVNRTKFLNYAELIRKGIECARKAVEEVGESEKYIAFDMGPTGKLRRLDFDRNYE